MSKLFHVTDKETEKMNEILKLIEEADEDVVVHGEGMDESDLDELFDGLDWRNKAIEVSINQGYESAYFHPKYLAKIEKIFGAKAIKADSDIDAEVERYYSENEKEIDEAFSKYCFYEGNFEHQDQKKMFNNDRVFWEFVESYMYKNDDSLKATGSKVINSMEDALNIALTTNDSREYDADCFFYVDGKQYKAYTAHISRREIMLYSDECVANFVVNTMGNTHSVVLDSVEYSDQAASMYNYEMANKIGEVILKHFPDSYVSVDTEGPLGSKDVYVRFAYGKNKDQWENGIIHNDPLHTVFAVQGWDTGYNGFVEDPKSVKAKILIGVRDIKFPSNKMSPETLVKKLDEYFGKLKEYHESGKATSNVDSGKLQKISDAFSHLNPEAGQYLASYIFYFAPHDHMVDIEDDAEVYEKYAAELPVLRSNNHEDFDKLQAKKIQEVADIVATLDEDEAKCLNMMVYNNFEIYDGERSPEFTEFNKKIESVATLISEQDFGDVICEDCNKEKCECGEASSQKVDRKNSHNDSGYYDARNSQYIVVNEGESSDDGSESPKAGDRIEYNFNIYEVVSYQGGFVTLKIVRKNRPEFVSEEAKKTGEVRVSVNYPKWKEAVEKWLNESTAKVIADTMDKYVITIEFSTDATLEEVEEIASHCYTQLETLGDEYGRKHTPSEYRVKKLTHNTTASKPVSVKYWTIEQQVGTKFKYVESFKNNYIKTTNDIKEAIFFKTKKDAEKFKDDMITMADGSEMKFETLKLVVAPHTFNKSFASTKVSAMNDVIKKAELINSKIGSVSGDWEKELEMKFSEAADVDFESTYSNGNDSISLIDMYVFLKDKSLKVKLGIAGDTECETEEICGKLISAEYSVDGKEFFPFTHFSEEYTNRKLEEGELLEAGEKALKDQEKLIEKQEKEDKKELDKLKKEYEAK